MVPAVVQELYEPRLAASLEAAGLPLLDSGYRPEVTRTATLVVTVNGDPVVVPAQVFAGLSDPSSVELDLGDEAFVEHSEDERLVNKRLELLKEEIVDAWLALDPAYELVVEPEVHWRLGGPPDRRQGEGR